MARKPRAGQEREFKRWLDRITATAAAMPGHLGSDLQAPGPEHPDEWTIVYQFESQSLLDDWIDSPVRAALLAEGAELTEGESRVQHLAMGVGENPVTAVASFEVKQGRWAEFEEGYDRILQSISRFDGFLSAQLFPPVDDVQDETVIVFSFRSRDQLDAWLTSDERREQLELLDDLVEGDRHVNVVGGFGGWFNLGQRQVKTWKQAAVVLLALYPMVLVINELLGWLLPADFPYLLSVLLGNIIGVGVLSWVLMPRLTSILHNWLRR
ncbi:MAG: hypothetical protein HKN03_16550 [Acidimicrobiales bacterium]|nr:hypothetical protein [Acidimicrobiales bacterium]